MYVICWTSRIAITLIRNGEAMRTLAAMISLSFALYGQSSRDEISTKTLTLPSLVKGGEVQANWMEDGNSFWFTESGPDGPEIWKYDPVRARRVPLLDLARLREALESLAGHKLFADRLPFENLTVLPGEQFVRLTLEGRGFTLRLDSYQVAAESQTENERRKPRLLRKAKIVGPPPATETISPDGAWFLGSSEGNLYLRSTADGHIEPLTTDGNEDYGWDYEWDSIPVWAPDSHAFTARKTDQRGRVISRYPIMHWLRSPTDVEWVATGIMGAKTEYYFVEMVSKKLTRIEQGSGVIHIRAWRPDSSELLMTRSDGKMLDVVAADRKSGTTRLVLAEQTRTFFDVGLTLPNSPNFTSLADNRRFLWLSERDGWNQIYLYGFDGTLLRKLTTEQRPVERIVALDEKNGWIYYTAHGTEGRPYDMQLYRVNLNGGNAARLTTAEGQHDLPVYDTYLGARGAGIWFSPSRKFFLDMHSSVNRPPQTELRRADGTLVEVLSRANASAAMAIAPNPPEELTAKAADGVTDLFGVLYKPYDFDPNKRYPVLDFIYAGPQMMRVPRTFANDARERAYANLGIIVFVVDARGTPGRGKAFQDVVYGNVGRNEIPNHVAVLKQIAAARSYVDMSRVGVLGGSFGGYFAIRAMLQAPEVFQTGIALAPDGGTDSLRLWMGSPEENKEGYAFALNTGMAGNLRGHLLLIHGTSDTNAPFASTVRMIDALERAGKPYDLVILPEQDHGAQNSLYALQAVKRYLIEHLKP
jgi:dipeptidyl aminopeptidase/acylaminoacyl peptidase